MPAPSPTTDPLPGAGHRCAATQRAATHHRYGAARDVVTVTEIDVPSPRPNEVLIEVEASSLNAIDHHMVTGTPWFMRMMAGLRRPKRTTVGSDVAGRIVEVGVDVTDWSVGDRVVGLVDGGGCAEYVATTTSGLARLTDDVAVDDAAATPVAGLTALQGLRRHAGLEAGERVLVNGAAGGVGTFAVQIAAATGAEVTAVCSTRNVEMVSELGATHVIDYTADDPVEVLADGDRFDVVFDNVGNLSPRRLARLVSRDGRIALTTGPKRNRLLGPIPHVISTRLSFAFRSASLTSFVASASSDDMETLVAMIADGSVRPKIDRRIGLDQVATGLDEIATGHTRAKIVVHPTS